MITAKDAIDRTTAAILRGLQLDAGSNDSLLHKIAGKTLLLTGAGGFLGRWIVRTIAAFNASSPARCKVIAIDSQAAAGDAIVGELRENCDFIYSDLSIPLGISERIDFAIHAAGIASPYWYKRNPMETIGAAVDGSRYVIKLLRDPQNEGARYLFCSSSEVYQTPDEDHVPTREDYVGAIPTMSDRSAYDVSKALGETIAYVNHERYGINTGVVRIFNSFGPGIAEYDHRILPRIASAIKGHRPIRVFVPRDGSQPSRTYCPVANTVQGILRALILGSPGEVYNIGAASPEITVQDLVQKCWSMLDRESPDQDKADFQQGYEVRFETVDPPTVYNKEPQRRCPHIGKAVRDLGYDPIVGLDEGLRMFLAWALETYTGEVVPDVR